MELMEVAAASLSTWVAYNLLGVKINRDEDNLKKIVHMYSE